jgi:ribosomal protein S18 acetylase RimI-like enzyme
VVTLASLEIRAATMQDISSIVRLRLHALTDEEIRGFSAPDAPEYATFTEETLRRAWDRENVLNDGCRVFVAEDEGKMVGYVVFKVERDYGYIDRLLVAKEERRKGIGRALVTYVERMTTASCRCRMRTDTTENAEGVPWNAYGFWITMGYADTGERVPTQWKFKTIPFVKKLT